MSQRSNEANKVENYLDLLEVFLGELQQGRPLLSNFINYNRNKAKSDLLEVRDQQSVPLKGTKLCVNSQET
jgi:hypothetical protein